MTQRNDTIDLIKLILSIMVIGIHTKLFEHINTTLYNVTTLGLFRISVPFFFVCSGYFFYKKIEEKRETSSYFRKLIRIYLIFEVFEILIYTAPLMLWGDKTVLDLVHSFFTTGLGAIYWYLISLVLTLAILQPLWKKGIIVPGLIIGLVLYLFMMTNDSYSFLFTGTTIQKYAIMHTNFWKWPQAGLCSSVMFVSIGAMLRKRAWHVPSIVVIMTVIFVMIEAYFCQRMNPYDGNGYLSLIIAAPLLFLWALYHPVHINYRYCGELSLYIYMIHPFFNNILGVAVQGTLKFVFVALGTILLSYLIVKRKHKTKQV